MLLVAKRDAIVAAGRRLLSVYLIFQPNSLILVERIAVYHLKLLLTLRIRSSQLNLLLLQALVVKAHLILGNCVFVRIASLLKLVFRIRRTDFLCAVHACRLSLVSYFVLVSIYALAAVGRCSLVAVGLLVARLPRLSHEDSAVALHCAQITLH